MDPISLNKPNTVLTTTNTAVYDNCSVFYASEANKYEENFRKIFIRKEV